jgi:hypothetical protein
VTGFKNLMGLLGIDSLGYEEELFRDEVERRGGPDEAQWLVIRRGAP